MSWSSKGSTRSSPWGVITPDARTGVWAVTACFAEDLKVLVDKCDRNKKCAQATCWQSYWKSLSHQAKVGGPSPLLSTGETHLSAVASSGLQVQKRHGHIGASGGDYCFMTMIYCALQFCKLPLHCSSVYSPLLYCFAHKETMRS